MSDGYVRTHGDEIVNLANVVTFARLCCVPAAIWLSLHQRLEATFLMFAAAGLSDALDGWLARRRGGTPLGAMLDPLADKALLVSMFIVLAVIGVLPTWLAVLAVSRDVVIVAGLLLLWQQGVPVRMRPLWISKLNTALQLLLVGGALLASGFGLDGGMMLEALIWMVAATILVSGSAYMWRAARGTLA